MSHGFHHYSKRTKKPEKLKSNSSVIKFKKFMDKAIYFVGVVAPLMTMPQLLKIWIGKNATGVSVISWIAYAFNSAFWIVYGILHKEKPIIVTYAFWFILNILVVIGTLIYG